MLRDLQKKRFRQKYDQALEPLQLPEEAPAALTLREYGNTTAGVRRVLSVAG